MLYDSDILHILGPFHILLEAFRMFWYLVILVFKFSSFFPHLLDGAPGRSLWLEHMSPSVLYENYILFCYGQESNKK